MGTEYITCKIHHVYQASNIFRKMIFVGVASAVAMNCERVSVSAFVEE